MSASRLALRWLGRDRLSVFLFHKVPRVADALTPYDLALPMFERMLDFIAEHFRVIPLGDAVTALERGRLPRNAACITFDDGYPGWVEDAAPALQRRGMHATFFITSGQFDGEPMWHERVTCALRAAPGAALEVPGLGLAALPVATAEERRASSQLAENLLKYLPLRTRDGLIARIEAAAGVTRDAVPRMASADLRQLHSLGFDIGGHTLSHPILALCDDAEAMREIGAVREQLESITGGSVSAFAYPNGRPVVDFGADHVAMVRRAGYRCAVTTQWGGGRASASAFQVPRFTPWGPGRLRMALQVGRNLLTRPRVISLPPAAAGPAAPWPARPVRVLSVENGAGFGGAVVALQTLLAQFEPARVESHVVSNLAVGRFGELATVRSHRVIGDRLRDFRPLARRVRRWRSQTLASVVLFGLGRVDDLVNRLPYLVRLGWHASRLRPDIMHGNNDPSSNREAMLVAKLLRRPYIQHVRGPIGESRGSPWLLARPNAFVPVSRWLSGELLQAGVATERVRQIYDGIALGAGAWRGGAGALRAAYGIAADATVIAMIGMLVPWKGQALFIDAARALRERGGRRAVFLVIGGLPERGDAAYAAALRELASRSGLGDDIVFTGTRSDLPALLPEIDIAVSASTDPEPLGLVMLEAMTAGCIFVGPAFGAATEVVEDGVNGFLFTPRSAPSLAAKLGEAMSRLGERAAIAARARAAVAGQFGAQACADATMRLVRSLAQGEL